VISKLPVELEAQVLIEQELHLDGQQVAFAIGGIGQAGADIAFGQFGVLIKNLLSYTYFTRDVDVRLAILLERRASGECSAVAQTRCALYALVRIRPSCRAQALALAIMRLDAV
jgi:hypothetical protein